MRSLERFEGRLRWWVFLLLASLSVIAFVWVVLIWEASGQERFLYGAMIAGSSLILFLLWVLVLSGLQWRRRILVFAVLALAGGVTAILFRVRGVSGDLVPILEWRFATPRAARLVENDSDGTKYAKGSRPASEKAAVKPTISLLDYPQFLGPRRDGTVEGVLLARDWSKAPPRLLWRKNIGAAWSGFAVAGDAAFTQEQHGELEVVASYSLETGELKWLHSDTTRYETVIGGIGPRATPTVSESRVYTLGATGLLNCLDRYTGERYWVRDIIEDNGSSLKEWGMSGSPLVYEGLVIASAGGKDNRSLVAYRKDNGEPAWQGGDDDAGYSSPLSAVLGGFPQVIILNRASVAAHDPGSGKVLWSKPWPHANPSPAQPLVLPGDRLLVSGGYGVGSVLYRIEKSSEGGCSAGEVWKSRGLKSKFANFVHKDGFVYGLDDGILVCLDLETGERRWKGGRYGHGQMILAGDLLLISAESGDVALLEATPEGQRELARFSAFAGKTWNCPALAAPYLLVRNDEEAACYELPLAEPLAR